MPKNCGPTIITCSSKGNHDKKEDKEQKFDHIALAVQRRFLEFQNATSELKRQGHNPDRSVYQAALNHFLSFIDPNFQYYAFDTVGGVYTFPTLADVATAYNYYATVLFNGYSQHYAENTIVTVVPGSNGRQARLTSGGGEYASLNNALSPTGLIEQHTISQWDIIWTYTNGNWYVYNYTEYGNRLYVTIPPESPSILYWARNFPGAIQPPYTFPTLGATAARGPAPAPAAQVRLPARPYEVPTK